MMNLFTTLLIGTASVLAQPPAPSAGDGYMQCLYSYKFGQKEMLVATVTPEEAAATIIRACAAHHEAFKKAWFVRVDALFPPDMAAVEKATTELAFSQKWIADGIRVDRAMRANDQCISSNIEKLAATVTPEAGAETLFIACAAQREAYLKVRLAALEVRPYKDEWSTALVTQYKSELSNGKKEIANAKKEIANAIRKKRGEVLTRNR